ncbi:MAG: hypothetical protein HYY06_08245 [Deltaproteobacteria bacterium]|nr:hypothetical protein [Deltaproteobacteria bacterium]
MFAAISLAASSGSIIDLDFTLAVQLLLFLGLFLILRPLLFRRLVRLFAAREESIEGATKEAKRMEQESRSKTAAYEEAMKRVRAEAAVEREVLKTEGAKAAASVVSTARDNATRHLEEGKRRIADEAQSLRAQLAPRTKELAADLARKLLGRDPGGAA